MPSEIIVIGSCKQLEKFLIINLNVLVKLLVAFQFDCVFLG